MDPPSISAATGNLVFTIVKTGKTLTTLVSEQETAPRCALLIQTEFVVLAAALCQIQLIFSAPTVRNYPEKLVRALELTVVGCDLAFSVMNKKIGWLRRLSSEKDVAVEERERASQVWNGGYMAHFLQQIKLQSSAMALVLKALDCWSMERILVTVESGQQTFEEIKEDIASIRQAYPNEQFTRSIQDVSRYEAKPLYSLMEANQASTTHGSSQRVFLRGPRFTQSALPSSSSTEGARGITGSNETDATVIASRPHGRRRGLRTVGVRMPQTSPALPSPPSSEDLFIEALDSLQRKTMAPALAVGIVSKDGSSTYVRGVRRHGCSVSVTRNDRFGIAGVSNMMISTLLAVMIEKGLLHWDTMIKDALPDMVEVIHPEHHGTTLEMLCAHVSGIETSVWEIDQGKVWDQLKHMPGHEGRTTVARAVLAVPPTQTPGRTALWNENNMLIVALVLEQRSFESLEMLLKRELFDPLEMYSTAADAADKAREKGSVDEPSEPWPHSMSPEGEQPIPREPDIQAEYIPAAYQHLDNIHSSIPDLVKFFELHLRGFLGQPTILLNFSSFQKLQTPFLGTDRTPGGWCGTTCDLHMVETFHGWSVSVSMSSSKQEAYVCLANVGSPFSDFVPEEFKQIVELCMERSPDIPFQKQSPGSSKIAHEPI